MTTGVTRRGSIPAAMAWMIALSIALSWVPFLGGLVAGYVGGSKAGSMGRAAAAVFIPGIVLFLTVFLLGGILSSIPFLGVIFVKIIGMGAFALSFMNIIPLLVGALIGGKMSE